MNKVTTNRKRFIDLLVDKTGLTKQQVREVVYEPFIEVLTEELHAGRCVLIGDLCRLQAVLRPEGVGMNPHTGKKIQRPAKARLKATLGAAAAYGLTESLH